MVDKIKAVMIHDAQCIGSGSDIYKRVNGITRKVLSQTAELEKEHGDLVMLARSHTSYNGQSWKKIVRRRDGQGYQHRQITDDNYEIVEVI